MSNETFQPISVKSPAENPLLFKIRCFVDLQLGTIVDFLKPEITKFPHGPIIDIGAGESPWKAWLPKNCRYFGIDIRSSKEFGMSQRNKEVVLYDGGTMPLESDFFDGAICIEVLEHAANPDELLAEISRIMKPGSTLLLTVPWSARRHHIPHDYHRFTKEQLSIMLSRHGFTHCSIKERGNDYCVIANKLIVVLIRHLSGINIFNFFYKIPLIMVFLLLSFIMLCIASISMMFTSVNNEDPLGYACKAIKDKATS